MKKITKLWSILISFLKKSDAIENKSLCNNFTKFLRETEMNHFCKCDLENKIKPFLVLIY